MEILDVDMQMVRDALKDAPEYVKGHFENLVSEHAKEADRAEEVAELRTKLETAEAELEEAKEEIKSLEEDVEADAAEKESALEAVRDWMHDVMFLGRGMRDPRAILRIVERALGYN